MKAADVIQAYKNGERNFQGLNLRGANFKGQNLSGADFSYCQIQSANFSQANLTDAKFIGAKAGLQLTQFAVLAIAWFICSLLLGFFVGLAGVISGANFSYYLFPENEAEINNIQVILGNMIVLIGLFLIYLTIIKKDFGVFTFSVFISLIIFGTIAWSSIFEGFFNSMGLIVAWGGGGTIISILFYTLSGVVFATIIGSKYSEIIGTFIAGSGIILVIAVLYWSNILTVYNIIGSFVVIISGIIIGGYMSLNYKNLSYQDSWIINLALTYGSVGGTNFYNANLSNTNFTKATLKNTDFNEANLKQTCLQETVKLNFARPRNTLLINPEVRDLLINPSSGEGKDFANANLRGANLKAANLQNANLTQADISEATFEYANLSHANLTEVNAIKTDFTNTYLTGACIENWNIDATTILDNIDCQYVFLLEHFNEHGSRERRPNSGDFKQGEFTELFKEVFDTVDLIFRNGIDWKAFIETMKTVQVENEDTPLEVSSIENKGDGVFVVKVKVPPDANKGKIHQDFNDVYQLKLEAVEAKYKAQLEAKETEITIYRQQSIDMMEIVKTQASRPINVEAKAMNNSPDNSQNISIGELKNSGNLNIGKTIEDVNNTINQISENKDTKNGELKSLLHELMTAIETENELDDDEKADAANKVKTIAEASQNPDDEGLQKKASRAVKLLETIAKGLEPATKLATACKIVLPKIISLLPFLA